MRQGRVDSYGASGTSETIGERLHRLPSGGVGTGGCRLLFPLTGSVRVTILPAGLPGPHTSPDLVRVVEAGGALGRAGLAVETGVVGVALPGYGAGVHSVLTGTVGVTCNTGTIKTAALILLIKMLSAK